MPAPPPASRSASGAPPLRPWEVLSSSVAYDASPRFVLEREDVRLPDGQIIRGWHRLRKPDVVFVCPVDEAGRILLLRHYKHGAGRVGLSLVAGHVEAGEEPAEAARRELAEEAGLEAAAWRGLGAFQTDGNLGVARAHMFLARGLSRLASPPPSDDLEETELLWRSPEEALAALRAGDFLVASAAACLLLALDALRDTA